MEPGPFAEAVLTNRPSGSRCRGDVRRGVLADALRSCRYRRCHVHGHCRAPLVQLSESARPGRCDLLGAGLHTTARSVATRGPGRVDSDGLSTSLRSRRLRRRWQARCTIAVRQEERRQRARDIARLTILTTAMLMPYFSVRYGGRAGSSRDFGRGIEFARDESGGFTLEFPTFGLGSVGDAGTFSLTWWNRSDSAAYLVYCSRAIVLLSLLLLFANRRLRADRERAPVLWGALFMLAMYDVVDLQVPYRVTGRRCRVADGNPWRLVHGDAPSSDGTSGRTTACRNRTCVRGCRARRGSRICGAERGRRRQLPQSSARDGAVAPPRILERLKYQTTAGRQWPWTRFWPGEPVPALIDYLNACTRPGERLFVAWSAPEFYVFSRRGFAAGHASFPHGGGYISRTRSAAHDRAFRTRIGAGAY